MRTTLKKGFGRGTAVIGNGRAVVPPSALTPITRYMQPSVRLRGLRLVGRILVWLTATALMLGAAFAGGVYLYFHESVDAIRARTPDLKAAAKQLDIVPPHRPAIAAVLGYDQRANEKGLPSRSDTVMLLRADPETKAVSMLSFPRDLMVEVRCPDRYPVVDRLNSAYARCGARGTLDTVRTLTGVPVNYLITVNFRAFKQIVSRLGGVWIDVDRRYFNDNSGYGERYATINLQPGYQLLNGSEALDFVRYRHTDSDLYRNARQQLFVQALKEKLSNSFGYTSLPKIVASITQNVEVGVGGGGELSGNTVLRYALFAYTLPPGHFFQSRIEGLYGTNELYAPSGAVQAAVEEFVNPDVDAADKAATAVGIRRKLKRRGPPPSQVTVVVLNGNGVPGAAANTSYLLAQRGYQTLVPPNNLDANAPRQDYFRTQIYHDVRKRRADEAAQGLKRLFGLADVSRGFPPKLRPYVGGAMTLVVVGQTFHGTIAPAPKDRTPPKQPAAVVKNVGLTIGSLRSTRRRVPFRLMVPTVVERSSLLASESPVRVYPLPDGRRGVRLTFNRGLEYWGIQQTDWKDAPILQEKSFRHVFKDGRTYDLYFSGPKLRMIVLHYRGATYWVVNTLLNTLSNETMLAIAKGLKPLPRK